ncbi:hypothetical protein F441_00440 [Phytophthora nicotianae CJ01A1]|uniref:Uncharacterized protein n=1 Tax=Phytophthora nicotianae CJ01A1 TaxID=1317063 RepID=W2XWT4_PHYNI|nr:hypothetical protein F441_00440 [Phytophthora nicotianae CJ01A1]
MVTPSAAMNRPNALIAVWQARWELADDYYLNILGTKQSTSLRDTTIAKAERIPDSSKCLKQL